jgi:hypothetical protein
MIDVIQALELFEICADELAADELEDSSGGREAGRRRPSLTARALAKQQLHVAHLARFPLRRSWLDPSATDEPAMTLGAMVVFRTADRFGRAGASTERTLDAIYHAVQRYVDIIPTALQDGTDRAAVGALLADAQRPSRPGRCRCRLGPGVGAPSRLVEPSSARFSVSGAQ